MSCAGAWSSARSAVLTLAQIATPAPPVTLTDAIGAYWPVFALSFLISLALTPLCRRFALKKGIVDKPDEWLKPHDRPIAYLGGVAIFLGWLAGLLYVAFAFDRYDPAAVAVAPPGAPVVDFRLALGIAVAGLAIMLLGLTDDLKMLPPKVKLAGNLAVAAIVLAIGLGDDIIVAFARRVHVRIDLESEQALVLLYSVPISTFIIVGACNATNLIDGLDGLCSGVIGIISIGFFVLATHLQVHAPWNPWDAMRVTMSLSLLGAALGFLPFNHNPAKIFMGDAGSMLLGLNCAIIVLLFAKNDKFHWSFAALVIFGLPIADMVLTLARRWRAQRPLMQGDRSHFYDQLVDRGWGVKKVVLISYLLTAFFVGLGLLPTVTRMRYAILAYIAAALILAYAVHRFRMVRVDGPKTRPEP